MNCRTIMMLVLCLATAPFFAPELQAAPLPDIIARIKPSIVGVGTYQPTGRPPAKFLGTGFVVADGRHILTNAHVMPPMLDSDKKEVLAVFVGQGEMAQMRLATRVAEDRDHDLTVLRIEGEALPALPLANGETVREGESFVFTGFPIGTVLGLYPATHQGIVSAVTPIAIPLTAGKDLTPDRIKRLQNGYQVLQLDATAYPGNSGSPLYRPETGEVVGIINMVFVKDSKESMLERPSGITYAIPIQYAHPLIDNALTNSKPRP